ncbi:hypothetical protein [Mesorhizobium sp.]|uniref:hypothetical protein n=1 Tax=Mesorhizobium sp. TaxID=1871066 RepID=UPI000FE88772|nr:hypothetical protein [Mesorhizobium sp.]RWO78431.1 MAG: hypothetical protein EOQ96_30375 [Mesorhizobium sp.]
MHAAGDQLGNLCANRPTYVNLISQDNDWHSLRLGLAGQTQLTERLSLSGDVAFLFTRLDGKDQHHMRPKIKLIPEDGDGHGVQLEAVLRPWRITAPLISKRQWAVVVSPQADDWKAKRYGVFVQASINFN